MPIQLKINNKDHKVEASGDTPLLWVLRDELGLTGTKYGCGVAQCGACTVHVNGLPRRACVTPITSVEGAEITTIEGLEGKEADAVRAAWEAIDVPQCGYCQAGQVMSAVVLLRAVDKPTDDDIDRGMNGNLCRCATYIRIRRAIHDAVERLGE